METQAGAALAEPEIPPPGEERSQVFADLRSCRSSIVRLEADLRRTNDDYECWALAEEIENMTTDLAKLERQALAINEEELGG